MSLNGEGKVRSIPDHMRALVCVVRDLSESGHGGTRRAVDIVGHSFGGALVGSLASYCSKEGVPVRKVVLLGSHGPPVQMSPTPWHGRFFQSPLSTVDELKPWWVPSAIVQALCKAGLGMVFTPNNSNTMFGVKYAEYFGNTDYQATQPTLLLWGDHDMAAC